MNISGTFSAPFLRSDLSFTIKILKAQPEFKVKLQEEECKYELYIKTTTNGSNTVQGIDFEEPFAPTSLFENICILLAIAAAEAMLLFPLNISNTFQTNIESKLSNRVHMSIPPFTWHNSSPNDQTIHLKAHQLTSYVFELSAQGKDPKIQEGIIIFFSKPFVSMNLEL
eukprot:7406482-Ditylum_brightwellii.AAC.1